MTDFRFTSPDGKEIVVTGPEGSTKEQALEIAKQRYAKERPSDPAAMSLAERAQEVYGFDPNIKQRGTILPFGRNKQGGLELATPGIIKDMLTSALAPGHMAQSPGGMFPGRQGQMTEQDITKTALDLMPGRTLGAASSGMTKKQFIKAAPDAETLAARSQDLYKNIGDDTIQWGQAYEMVDNITKALGTGATRSKTLNPKSRGLLKEWNERLTEALKSGKNEYNMDELDLMRQEAGALFKGADREARAGAIMQAQIDKVIDKLPDTKTIKEARKLWRQRAKTADIEEMIYKAKNAASGYESGLRNEFRKYINNPKKRKNLTSQEHKAMQRVVQGGSVGNFMRKLKFFGPSEGANPRMMGPVIGSAIGGAVAGPAGAMGLPAIGYGAGKLATRSTEQAAQLAKALAAMGGSRNQFRGGGLLTRKLAGPMVGSQFLERREYY